MGTGVAAPPVDGAVVAGTAAARGAAVGEGELPLGRGVAVAEDPQANKSATNNRTIALGRCPMNLDFGTALSPLLRVTF